MGVFDGMAGALNDAFGGPVTVTTAARGVLQGTGILRQKPSSVATEDGHSVLVTSPTLRLQKPDADLVQTGDLVQGCGSAKRFRILNRLASGSPADDAFVIFELEDEL